MSSATPNADATADAVSSNPETKKKKKKKQSVAKVKFKGETEAMNEFIFETAEEAKDPTMFVKTLEALERYSYKTYTSDLSSIFYQPVGELPTIDKPEKPKKDADEYDKEEYSIKIKAHHANVKTLQVETKALWSVVWGQCSHSLVSKLMDETNMDTWKKEGNVVELLQTIKKIMMKFTIKTNPEVNLHKHLAFFYNYQQKEKDDIHKYFELFKIMADGIQNFGGNLGKHDLFIRRVMEHNNMVKDGATQQEFYTTYAALSADEKEAVLSAAESRGLAIAFLMGGNPQQYGQLILGLQNQFLMKNDQFPKTLTEAYNLMSNYLVDPQKYAIDATASSKELKNSVYSLRLSFLQGPFEPLHDTDAFEPLQDVSEESQSFASSSDSDTDGSDNDDDIKSTDESGDSFGMCFTARGIVTNGDYDYSQLKNKLSTLKPTWILLDTQSSCDIFHNKDFLSNIHDKPDGGLVLKSNGNGDIRTCQVGTLKGYGQVWFHEKSLANILSFANVRRKFKITVTTGPNDPCPTLCVHRNDGHIMEFREHANGLYIYDAEEFLGKSNSTKLQVTNYSFLETVENNEQQYTPAQLKRSRLALQLYRRLGRPAPQRFIAYLNNNWIHDLPFTSADARRAFDIYGTDPAHLMGKTRRQKPPPVPALMHIPLPTSIAQLHRNVTVSVDIFYINGIRFFHSISHNIQLRTVEVLTSATEENLIKCVKRVINLYQSRGFTVIEVRGDQQFECIEHGITPVHLYTSTAGEHIPQVERSIQTIEGDCRAIYHGLPYRSYPAIMLRSLCRSKSKSFST